MRLTGASVMQCANNCGNYAPEGFSTCSHECALHFASVTGGESLPPPPAAPENLEPPPGLLNKYGMAEALGVKVQSISSWRRFNRIKIAFTTADGVDWYDLEKCRAELGGLIEFRKARREFSLTDRPQAEIKVFMPAESPLPTEPVYIQAPVGADFEAIRARAVKVARAAYRDEILNASDWAEKREDLPLQVKLLKEFVTAEEAFKVIFGEELN